MRKKVAQREREIYNYKSGLEKKLQNQKRTPGESDSYLNQALKFIVGAENAGYKVSKSFADQTKNWDQANYVASKEEDLGNPSKRHFTLHKARPEYGHYTSQLHARGEQKENGSQSKIVYHQGKMTGKAYASKNGDTHSRSSLSKVTSDSSESTRQVEKGFNIAEFMTGNPISNKVKLNMIRKLRS